MRRDGQEKISEGRTISRLKIQQVQSWKVRRITNRSIWLHQWSRKECGKWAFTQTKTGHVVPYKLWFDLMFVLSRMKKLWAETVKLPISVWCKPIVRKQKGLWKTKTEFKGPCTEFLHITQSQTSPVGFPFELLTFYHITLSLNRSLFSKLKED